MRQHVKQQNTTRQDILGLSPRQTEEISEKLNKLLANYSVFYQNIRGHHWNIQGHEFFELHEKFEELYEDVAEKIDTIAERIVTLGYIPWHSSSMHLENSKIEESGPQPNGVKAVDDILASFKIILKLQRELLDITDDAKDEGTNALMSDNIKEQEETIWMYSAFLES